MKSTSLAAVSCVVFLISAFTSPLASPAYTQEGSLSACTDEGLKFRNDLISIGASITYGNSLDEVALYRLLTGIDYTLLSKDRRSLFWSGTPELPEGVAEASIGFADLLVPADQLEGMSTAYIRYYHAQDMLMQRGLRSYRPERGGPENAADW
jgi:hypothetical protein